MESERIPTDKKDVLFEPQNLHYPPAVASFSVTRLQQLWELMGQDVSMFVEQYILRDVRSKDYVQSYSVGEIPSMEYEWMGKGSPITKKMVGWMRARIDTVLAGQPRFASLEATYIDPTVQVAPVEMHLLENLQHRVRNSRTIAGLTAIIPASHEERAERFKEWGFRTPTNDSFFIWKPE